MLKNLKNTIGGNDKNLKDLLQGSVVTFIIKIIGMLLGYALLWYISRVYGAKGTGVYTLTLSLIEVLSIFCVLGLNIAILRYVGQYNTDSKGFSNMKKLLEHSFKLVFPVSILISIILFLFASEISIHIFKDKIYTNSLKIAAYILPFLTLTSLSVEFIRGLKLIKISEYIRSINRPLIIFIVLILPLFCCGILDSIYALLIGVISSFFLSTIFIIRFFYKKSAHLDKAKNSLTIKELLNTSIPMMGTTISYFILLNIAPFFLEHYESSDKVGIFNVCLKLANLVSLILLTVNTISAPMFSELFWNNQKEDLQKVIHQSSRIIFWVSVIVALFIVVFSDQILIFFGEEFLLGKTTLIILTFGQIINAMTGSVGIFMNMSGNQRALRNILFFTCLLILIGYYFFVPKFGMIAAAVITASGVSLNNIILAYYSYRKLQITTFYIPFNNK